MAKVSDIKIQPSEYWLARADEVSKRAIKSGNLTSRQIEKLFKQTFNEIDSAIQSFYAKFGTITDSPTFSTLPDKTKVVSGSAKKLVVTGKSAYVATSKGTRLTDLQNRLYEILKKLATDQNDQMIIGLSEIYAESYGRSLFNTYKGVGVGKRLNLLTEDTIRTLIKHEVNGKNFSQRVWTNRDKLADNVNQILKTGIAQGISNTEMSKRLSSSMDSGFKVASALMQTETTNVLNQATLLGYTNSGIVEKYEYLSTLDSATSKVCKALDGKKFYVTEAVTGLNFPPMHVRCRSTTIPWFDDSAAGLTRIARTLGGDSFVIPADMNYDDYKSLV